MEREAGYYPEPLRRAIVNYERANTPGIRRPRQKLARVVVSIFNSGEEGQRLAVEGLLEAMELRTLASMADIRSELEAQFQQDEQSP